MKIYRENLYIIKFILFIYCSEPLVVNPFTASENVFNYNQDLPVVIIDAGHGGEDGGAVSDDGILEKDINLDIAKKIEYLFKMSDIPTAMTRDSDRMLYASGQENRKKHFDIRNRIEFVKSFEQALLISIHQNKFPIKKYSGFQVYCSKNNPDSECLGKNIQDIVIKNLQPQNKRQIKIADNIMILDHLDIPAVIAECGFLSNGEEAALLCDEDYKNKIAFLIYTAVLQFLK